MLLCDEPSLGLAPLITQELFRVLGSLRDEHGMSLLIVEQNVKQTLTVADRAYVLENGRIVLEGESHKLLNEEMIKKAYLGL